MGQAMAQVVAMSDRAMSWMPKGTLPPMIMRMDAGSVPVGYLVFESEETSLGMLGDLAQNVIRPLVQKYVPGTVAISPFGPNMRSIVIEVDPQKLLDYNLTPQQVVDALAKGNTIIPAGNIYVKDSMPVVANNATVVDIRHMGDIPLKVGLNVYLRDVATIRDDTDITYGYALVNGKKSVYLPIIKKDTGSTLTVVSDVHKSMQLFRDAVPKDVSVSFQFDESPTVVAAVESVATEGLIGACLTGLMILLFLRDWRSVIVVVSNIPLALLGSLFGLWLTGNTINIMSLGGLALAIGIPWSRSRRRSSSGDVGGPIGPAGWRAALGRPGPAHRPASARDPRRVRAPRRSGPRAAGPSPSGRSLPGPVGCPGGRPGAPRTGPP
jgi:multidrug efflux pump subunit AcrB